MFTRYVCRKVPSKAYYQVPCQAQTSVTTDPDLTGFMDPDPDPGRPKLVAHKK